MRFRQITALAATLWAVVLASCAQETYPPALLNRVAGVGVGVSAGAPRDPSVCRQTQAEALPARLVAMAAQTASGGPVVLIDDLFNRFNAGGVCGGCHGSTASQGGFQIQSATEFATAMTGPVLAHVTSNGGAAGPEVMPPLSSANGMLYSARPESDPIRQFAEIVQQWLLDGSPQQFTAAAPASASARPDAPGSFVMSVDTGDAMTNIGSCVPTPPIVATETDKSAALDAMFASAVAQTPVPGAPRPTAAAMIGLPEDLGATDLVSLDSGVLAQYGVVAYAPGYPLWSDNAGKLRYVRVPRGRSIHFDKVTQQFEIPPNTRFYKTFMKQVIDTDGSIRWRKIETRLIVSRPDVVDGQGNHTQTALFGTYQWNADESDATLVETALNDLLPFADTLLLYNTNEPLAANILRGLPSHPEQALVAAGASRHYAIPSSQRCIECHMGSPSAAFVLGFTPLQVARRPAGVGGVIEEASPDELTQLQRLIDYGVVTGIASPDDVLPLEAAEGNRAPRNDQELVAQGYMLGNCAHCHNPIGFPTVQNPVLKSLLNFLPSATGGIFQFPLELYSPRIERGVVENSQIPYITPSLMDLPRYDPANPTNVVEDRFAKAGVFAPWRSLLYRNVDDAFPYTDDQALFPHMPFNTPGYDPRAKQILGDWMVSIPAVRKHPELAEYAFFADSAGDQPSDVDASDQPYVEVIPGEAGYASAFEAAQQRLAVFHTGINPALPSSRSYSRYADPDETEDIVDPRVIADPVCHPTPRNDNTNPYPEARHPHWVLTDLTSPDGPWSPRRSDWASVLANGSPPPPETGCSAMAANSTATVQAHQDQLDAIDLLKSVFVKDISAFATTPIPFGLWIQDTGCDFTLGAVQDPTAWPLAAPPASAFSPQPQWTAAWMSVANAPPGAPVYMQTPGEAVFKNICINCHGPRADGRGRMADNLATMTGGLARVADFRDGLLGPVATPGANRDNQFALADLDGGAGSGWLGLSPEDRAGRYMPWMALGGTQVSIPSDILTLVGATKILDQPRTIAESSLSANMLSVAKAICESFFGDDGRYNDKGMGAGNVYLSDTLNTFLNVHTPAGNSTLRTGNGDAELWLRMCTLNNPPPIHVLNAFGTTLTQRPYLSNTGDGSLALTENYTVLVAERYPPGTPIGNERGIVDACLSGTTGCDPSIAPNLWPWCVDVSADNSAANDDGRRYVAAQRLPVCPSALVSISGSGAFMTTAQGNKWAVRGAINAGLSVFLYLEWLETQTQPPPDYDQCQLLP